MSRSSRGSLRAGPKKARPRTTDLRAFDSGLRVRLWFDGLTTPRKIERRLTRSPVEPWLWRSLWSMDCDSRGGVRNIHPVPTRHEKAIFPFVCSVATEFISTLRRPLGRATLMQEASVVRGR